MYQQQNPAVAAGQPGTMGTMGAMGISGWQQMPPQQPVQQPMNGVPVYQAQMPVQPQPAPQQQTQGQQQTDLRSEVGNFLKEGFNMLEEKNNQQQEDQEKDQEKKQDGDYTGYTVIAAGVAGAGLMWGAGKLKSIIFGGNAGSGPSDRDIEAGFNAIRALIGK